MKVVLLHSDWIEYEPVVKAIENVEEVNESISKYENALVALTTIEKEDNEDTIKKATDEILRVFNEVRPARVVIYPWAHLSNKLAEPSSAIKLLKLLESEIKSRGIETYRAPFGWYKRFKISVKGHPLAEQFRSISTKREKARARKIIKNYLILTPDGKEIVPENYNLEAFNKEFQLLIRKEVFHEESRPSKPVITKYLKRFGFEWEPYSDYGHMRFEPYAALIFDLAKEYSRKVIRKVGIPVYEVRGTAFFDLSLKPVKEHAELYGDRLYTIETDKGKFVLRYAACHQQFAMIKDWGISYSQLPFGAFEVADSYRYEQSGEVELSFRLRRFFMPDMHIFLKDEEEAKEYTFKIHKVIMNEVKALNRDYELLINVVSDDQYKRYKEFLIRIAKDLKKPVLVAIYKSERANYYWTINVEYHILDILGKPREIGTVQIDIGNSRRFGIRYVNKKGNKKYPVIIHTAIIGGIERYIYLLFDTALKMRKPMLPVWISPVQIRIIPTKKDYLKYAIDIANKLEEEMFRVDVDDTNRRLSRKIVDAEKEWIPYIVIIGEKEVKSNSVSVRDRKSNENLFISVDELINRLKRDTEGYPKRDRYYSLLLSERPVFIHY